MEAEGPWDLASEAPGGPVMPVLMDLARRPSTLPLQRASVHLHETTKIILENA